MNDQYGSPPILRGAYSVRCEEMMLFQYYPIKLVGEHEITREERLSPFDELIGASCCDFIGKYGLNRFMDSYVYLTAKHMWQGPGSSFNRPGWHCDGFMTEDINYIWCNKSPTIFCVQDFNLSQDDILSMEEMKTQAREECEITYPINTLLRIDQSVVHRVSIPQQTELRTFFKLSFSKDKYDLEGNAHNYLLSYNWEMRPRSTTRNIPQNIK